MIKVQIKPLPNSPALESVSDARTRTELMKVNENVKSVKGQLSECQKAVQELQQSGGSSSKVIVKPDEPEQPDVPDVDWDALNSLVARAENAANESISSAQSSSKSAGDALKSAEDANAKATNAEEYATEAKEAADKAEKAAASIVGGFRGPIILTIGGALGNHYNPDLSDMKFYLKDWGADENKTYNAVVLAWGWEDVDDKYTDGDVCFRISGLKNDFSVSGADNANNRRKIYSMKGSDYFEFWTTEPWLSATVIITEKA